MSSKYLRYYAVNLLLTILILAFFISLFGISFEGMFILIFIFIGIPVFIWFCLQFKAMSFTVGDNKLTINYGIVVKKSKTLLFNSIQTIDVETNALQELFHVSEVKIWTASPNQFNLRKAGKEKPDGTLYLLSEDAHQLKEMVHA
jgi:uncharacterized membrane protein YdbT with pleckstrin-like domain